MSWLRWWQGTVNDPKWRIVAARAGCRVGDCLSVWAYLLETAKDSEGDVSKLDTEECAIVLGYDLELVEAILTAMRNKSLIEGQRLPSWEKRQPKREDDSRARVAAFRDRKAQEKSVTEQRAEPCNAPVTQGNAPDTESETDTEKKEDPSSLRSDGAQREKPAARKSRMPSDFCPNDAGIATATAAGITGRELRDQLLRFADHHTAKGSLMVDWQAAWRTWCGNYRSFGRERAGPSHNPRPRTAHDAIADELRKYENAKPDHDHFAGITIDACPG